MTDPSLRALLATRPQRTTRDHGDPKLGECQTCGGRAWLADHVCGSCHDAEFLAEWQAYAGRLESALQDHAAPTATPQTPALPPRDGYLNARPISDLLRDVGTALCCYASARHAQAWRQKNATIKTELLAEVDRIEALERELRGARRAHLDLTPSETELLTELRAALTAFDTASAEEEAAMTLLMNASHHAPKNERGQFTDPAAVSAAAAPYRPRHQAAQDARLDAQDTISGLAAQSARLAVKLAGHPATAAPRDPEGTS